MVLLGVGSLAHSNPMKLSADRTFKNRSGLPLDAQRDGNSLVSEWISQMPRLAPYGNKYLRLLSHILDDGSVPRIQVDFLYRPLAQSERNASNRKCQVSPNRGN